MTTQAKLAHTATAFDLALVTDVATQVYSIEELAQKHNTDAHVIESLMENKLFVQQVETVKADIAKNGFLTKTRATSIINEDLLPRVQDELHSLDATADDIAKLGNLLLKLGGLDAKEANAGDKGPALPTITINIPAPTAPVIVHKFVEATTVEVKE